MCERSPEKYEATRQALYALLVRSTRMLRTAYAIRNELEYQLYMSKKDGQATALTESRILRVARTISTIREQRRKAVQLLDDLESWGPNEGICYGEFWSRIRSMNSVLDGLEKLLVKFRKEVVA